MAIPVAAEIAAIEKALTEHVEREAPEREKLAHPYIYASRRQKCLRRMVYEATEPNAFPAFDTDTKARFARGKRRELDITIDLQRAGQLSTPRFEFIGKEEAVKVYDRNGRLVVSGRVDGYIRWEYGPDWTVEVKSWSPFLTDRIFEFSDLMKSPYTWPGAHQLLAYLYSKSLPYGLFVLDRPGLPRLIPVSLEENLQAMEDFLHDATVCVDHIEAGTLPDYIDDPSECGRCPIYGSLCNPPVHYDTTEVLISEEVSAQLEMHEASKSNHKTYNEAHDTLKDYLAARTPKTATPRQKKQTICGNYVIESWWSKHTKLDLPESAKKEYQVVDPAGTFNFRIAVVSAVIPKVPTP